MFEVTKGSKQPRVQPFARIGHKRSIAVLFLAVLCFTGCSRQLLGAIDEISANRVVSSLRLEGIDADKAPAGDKGWKVMVADGDFARAVQIMERRNLPPAQFQGLGQVFKKESLVSTPTEERARLIHAMSQELERSLMEIDGVLVARVHPVILPHDPLNPKRVAATASVLIKHRAGIDMSGREGMVRGLVAAGIEGLAYDDVRVMMVPAEAMAGVGSGSGADKTSAAASQAPSWMPRVPSLYLWALAALLTALALSYAFLQKRRQGAAAGPQKKRLAGRWMNTQSASVFAGDSLAERAAPGGRSGKGQ